jgi:uncharacterized spore protein YtfJ
MKVEELVEKARDAATVSRVFGDPYEKGGVTFIPVARVAGGAGGGSGTDGESEGGGGGYGSRARPVGAYVIKDDEVTWLPAIDVTFIAFVGQIIAIVALLVLRTILKKRRKR